MAAVKPASLPRRLTYLNLFNVPILDHDIIFLSSLPALVELNLDSRSISDGGAAPPPLHDHKRQA